MEPVECLPKQAEMPDLSDESYISRREMHGRKTSEIRHRRDDVSAVRTKRPIKDGVDGEFWCAHMQDHALGRKGSKARASLAGGLVLDT